jgi:predicted phosphodiesterase
MNGPEMEQLFFRPPPTTATELTAQRRQSSKGYQPPPVRKELAPYHMNLAAVLPTRTPAIELAGQIVFHLVGDTGGVNGTEAQQNIADHMTGQVNGTELPEQPSFFYHLGDVVYKHGEESLYHDQFYHPYQDYPAPIFAIPGNHDGEVSAGSPKSLGAFMDHFCSLNAQHPLQAGHSDRPTMIQPNCYWRLEAPYVTIIGLYSNTTGELDNTDAGETIQRDWLVEELRSAPEEKCLLITVHHPPYGLGTHGGSPRIEEALDQAMTASGRIPDAVFSGHAHNYQRFTRLLSGRELPYIVAGAGGVAGYHLKKVHAELAPPPGVTLEHYDHKHPGFLRIRIDTKKLLGEYYTVPPAGKESKPEKLRDAFTLNWKKHKLG